MIRKDYLNAEYTAEDKKLIAFFQKQMQKINQIFQLALQEGDRKKALIHLRKMQAISTALKSEYGERAELRIPQEYLKGGFYIDDYLNNSSSLSRIKDQGDSKLMTSRIAQLGPVHTEAVKALMENSKMLVSASIDGMERHAMTVLTKYQQTQTKLKLAEGILSGDGLEKMKQNLTKMYQSSGITKFQDRAGRLRDMNRYVDMLTRTETKIANTQGTINRALESGITQFEVVEHEDCCEICAQHNGKIYDISKGSIELPPYHPNCRGMIVPVWEEDWANARISNDQLNSLYENIGSNKKISFIFDNSLSRETYDIIKSLNIAPEEYKHELSNHGLKHILRRHGEGKKIGKNELPVTKEEIKKIGIITRYADTTTLSDHDSRSGNKVIIYKKEMEGKKYSYLEFIDTKAGKLTTQTMYINKK